MCGISVIIAKSCEFLPEKLALERMMAAQSHRGPDGSGKVFLDWGEEKIWLGHNLLAISEVKEKAAQPLLSSDGVCGIVFNGQIFNHHSLRSELELLGYQFETAGDTETLLVWLRHYGRKGLCKLVGMYAFVYWDSDRQLLIIHRDGYGIKPLYYARNRHFMVFSSEPAGIFASGIFSPVPDSSSIGYYLKYKFIPQNKSPWQGIKQVLPGEAIEYWESKPLHYQVLLEPSNAESSIRVAINKAFHEVIPSKEKVGLMLSGGIDSSLILKWCVDNNIEVVPFSIRYQFETRLSADQKAVEFLEKLLGIQVHWIDVDWSEVSNLWKPTGVHEPLIADSARFLTRKIAEVARNSGIRILLSGAGADEWFAGYRRHWFFHQWNQYQHFVPGLFLEKMIQAFRIGKLKWMEMPEGGSPADVWDASVASRLGSVLQNRVQLPLPASPDDQTVLAKALAWDQKNYLVQDILNLTDQATMAFGVEGRFPFLHPAITGFAESVSAENRLAKGRKWLLKNEVEKWAGKEFVSRRKLGFGLPYGRYLSSPEGQNLLNDAFFLLGEKLPGFWKENEWSRFQKEAKAQPDDFAQEILALIWLSEWLKNQ
jgi:asparagine synthase (glutamine-hydrolysing)